MHSARKDTQPTNLFAGLLRFGRPVFAPDLILLSSSTTCSFLALVGGISIFARPASSPSPSTVTRTVMSPRPEPPSVSSRFSSRLSFNTSSRRENKEGYDHSNDLPRDRCTQQHTLRSVSDSGWSFTDSNVSVFQWVHFSSVQIVFWRPPISKSNRLCARYDGLGRMLLSSERDVTIPSSWMVSDFELRVYAANKTCVQAIL